MEIERVANAGGDGDGAAALAAPVELSSAAPFALGDLQVDPPLRQLTYPDGTRETLEPRVMEVLVALHRADGAPVSRDDLRRAGAVRWSARMPCSG